MNSTLMRREKHYLRLVLFLALAFFALFNSQTNAAPALEKHQLALVGATVIQANGSEPIADSVILIEKGLITYVGKRKEIRIADNIKVIDVTGKWITPGLIDTNEHLILNILPEFYIKYEDRLEDIALQSAQVALKYGLTTIGDTWGPIDPLLSVRDKINNGDEVGTRVLVAGNIIGAGGPFTASFMRGWDMRGNSLRYGGWVHPAIQFRINQKWEAGVGPSLLAATPEEVGEALRAYIARGVDFIKVGISGHGLGTVEPLVFSEDALKAMRREADRAGIPFTTHTFSIASTDMAIKLDTDFMLHPNVMSIPYASASEKQKFAIRKLAEQTAKKGIYVGLMAIPNKEQFEIMAHWDPKKAKDSFVNKIMVDRGQFASQSTYDRQVEGLKVWLDAGVKYTIATDAGPETADLGPTIWGRLGRAHFERMEALQHLGERPEDILIAATRHGAEAYNLQDHLGTIEKDKYADLLILDADPHLDIKNLRSIYMVIKEGRVINRDALPTVKVLDFDPEAEWPY